MVTHTQPTPDCFLPTHQNFILSQGFFLLPSVCVSYDKTSLLRRYEILEQEFSNCGVRKNHLGDMFNMQMPGPHASGHPGSQSGWSPGICTLPLFLGILMQVVPGHRGEMEVPRGESSHSKPCSRATTHISGPVVRIKWDNRWERALESIQHSINTRRHYYFQAGTALWQKWLGTFSLNYHNHLFEAPTKLITLSAAGMEEIPPETSSKKKILLMWECAWVPAWSSVKSSLPFLLLVPSFLGQTNISSNLGAPDFKALISGTWISGVFLRHLKLTCKHFGPQRASSTWAH